MHLYFNSSFKTTKHFVHKFLWLSLYCNNTNIYVSLLGEPLTDSILSCSDLNWKMYESISPLKWCKYRTGSFILATKMSDEILVLASACFDDDKSSFQTLNYLAGPKIRTKDHNNLQILGPIGLNETSLGPEVEHFRTLFKHMKFSEYTIQHFEFWIKFANYGYKPIVQGGPYTKLFDKYDTLLDIVWWPNLAAGNWKRFMDALAERTKNVTYNVFVGTSGVVQVPYKDKCTSQSFEELRIGTQNENGAVPAYIWTYLEDTESDEEFVFVGYNAPFYEFFSEKKIVFCNDICKNVTWLENIRSTFRYSTMGVTFCCSVEAVRSGNFLEGFPVAVGPTPSSVVFVDDTETESEGSSGENIIDID